MTTWQLTWDQTILAQVKETPCLIRLHFVSHMINLDQKLLEHMETPRQNRN